MSIGNKQYRVVIADDVEEVRESLRRVLEPNGYDAVSYTHLTLPTTPYV